MDPKMDPKMDIDEETKIRVDTWRGGPVIKDGESLRKGLYALDENGRPGRRLFSESRVPPPPQCEPSSLSGRIARSAHLELYDFASSLMPIPPETEARYELEVKKSLKCYRM